MVFEELYTTALDQELGTNDSTQLFTTAKRKRAVNNGLLAFADLTECFPQQSTIVSSHGVSEYNLLSTANVPSSATFLRLSGQGPEYQHTDTAGTVTYVAGRDFVRRDIEWLNDNEPGWRTSTGGTPRYYYERIDGNARYLGLVPPPQIDAGESAKVVLPYVAKPSTLSSTGDIPFGSRSDLEPYHQALVHYAAHELEKLRVNIEASQGQLVLFSSYVDRFRQFTRVKGGNTVRPLRHYFSDARSRRVAADTDMPGWYR